MTTTIDLTPLLNSPRLPDYAAIINECLQTENVRRARFYDEIDESQKAEFIDGLVIVHSPARHKHLVARQLLSSLLSYYVMRHELGEVLEEKTLCIFPRNDYEPDIVFFDITKAERFTDNQMKFPVPSFAVEVLSDSTDHRDRGVKFEDFEAHGVGEYWIIDADTEIVEQYVLQEGSFQLRLKSGSGEIESEIITGFRIPIKAIFDRSTNVATLQRILAE